MVMMSKEMHDPLGRSTSTGTWTYQIHALLHIVFSVGMACGEAGGGWNALAGKYLRCMKFVHAEQWVNVYEEQS